MEVYGCYAIVKNYFRFLQANLNKKIVVCTAHRPLETLVLMPEREEIINAHNLQCADSRVRALPLYSFWSYLLQNLGEVVCGERSFFDAYEVISQHGLSDLIEGFYFDNLRSTFRDAIVPNFWNEFVETGTSTTKSNWKEVAGPLKCGVLRLHKRIFALHTQLSLLQAARYRLGNTNGEPVHNSVRTLYRGILLAKIPQQFDDVVVRFFTIAFKAFVHNEAADETSGTEDDHAESLRCKGCDYEIDNCCCKEILMDFHAVNKKLGELTIWECLASDALTNVMHEYIRCHVESTCKGNFELQYLSSLERWLDDIVFGWLYAIFNGGDSKRDQTSCNPEIDRSIQTFKGHLQHFLYETFAMTRMDQMFNIIIEFPESQPAIEDLKDCLEKTDCRSRLVESLRMALKTRLLHPGVNTNDILIAYTSTIRTLSILDPAGVILELVCEPVHKYLRTRVDTVRCIVSSLTDDTSGELADELVKGEPLVLDESYQSEDDAEDWEIWRPDPVDADPEKYLKSRRTSDIISMLVNIYGSKELFIKEYRTLLANRILSQFKFDVQREIRYLELLKLRFGETNLHLCEVMLKDVADSKRMNLRIHSEDTEAHTEEDFVVNAMILSAQFWPPFRDGKIELPAKVKASLCKYTKAFETLKGNRTLNWQPHLGQVSLEIELKDRLLNLKVSPVHAIILIHFEDKPQWTLEELSAVMQAPSSQLKQKISFWQSYGIIREDEPDRYVLVEEQREKCIDAVVMEEEEEVESAMASLHDQREEELQVFWSYIVGMLTNLESLPLERIHAMLKMFATQSTTAMECSLQELRCFLQRKVLEHKLLFSGGLYKLSKPNI